jgi:HlyD family secretion protein
MLKKKKRVWILLGIVGVLVVSGLGYSLKTGGIVVDTSLVEVGDVVRLVKDTGTVESESAVVITALYSGKAGKAEAEEGDQVAAGDILLSMASGGASYDLAGLKAQLSGLQSQLKQASDLAKKNKTLYEQGAISLSDYNNSQIVVTELQSQVASLEYSIKSYEESSGVAGVFAPIDGIITAVYAKEGETILAGSPLFEISNLNDLYIRTDLVAEDADRVSLEDPVTILRRDSDYIDENGSVRKIHLKAQEILSDLGIVQKRVTVEIALGKKEGLRLGGDVDVEITVDRKEQVLRVDKRAVFQIGKQDHVYVIEGGMAVLTAIETGLSGEDFVEVSKGLKEGDPVILSPSNDIEDGTKVKTE